MKKFLFPSLLVIGLLFSTSCGSSEDENKAIKDALLEKSLKDAQESMFKEMEEASGQDGLPGATGASNPTSTSSVSPVEKQEEN